MSLTIGDANDVQQVLRWVAAMKSWDLVEKIPPSDPWHIDEHAIAQALVRLARRSSYRLGAGLDDRAMSAAPSVAFMLSQADDGHRGTE